MKNQTTKAEAMKCLEMAVRQLAYYDENDLCVIQDRNDVQYLAEEFGDEEIALCAKSPQVFEEVCGIVEQR